MQLVCLYGPPGVGKLTVGSALAELTGFRLFHNHLTVDLVNALFPPSTAAWNRLAARIRVEVFTEAAREGVDLILTRAPRGADPAEIERVQAMLEPVRREGGTVQFVQLACERGELLRRLQNADRQARGKLTDPQVLLDLYDLDATLPFEPHWRIDVTHIPPREAATQIARHSGLPLPSEPEPPTARRLDP